MRHSLCSLLHCIHATGPDVRPERAAGANWRRSTAVRCKSNETARIYN